MRPPGDAPSAPALDVPGLEIGARAGVALQPGDAVLPLVPVARLGQQPRLAQPVEDVAQRGARREDARRNLGQLGERGIEELEPAGRVEHRQPDRQVRERVG